MNPFLFIVGVLLFQAVSPAWGQQAPRPSSADEAVAFDPVAFEVWLDAFLADYLADSSYPSLAFALVQGDRVLFKKGYGFVHNDKQTRVDPDQTPFRVASLSKLVTATAVMQLVEQGKLRLDADVNQYLERFQVVCEAPVTVEQLLTHTGGIESFFLGATVQGADDIISLGAFFTRNPPRCSLPPGEEISYSNQGMALAGYLVEAVTGVSFDAYVEQYLFDPLGMQHSTFRQPYPPALTAALATAGIGLDQGYILPYPAGSMISTAADMARFVGAHLHEGEYRGGRILQAATVRAMHEQHVTHHPRMPGMAYGFMEDYTNGRRGLFHTGLSGHQSLLYLLPEERVGFFMVLATQQGGPFQDLRKRFVQAVLDRYYPPAEAFVLPEPPTGAARDEPSFAGVYRPDVLPVSRMERLGNLAMDTPVVPNPDGSFTLGLPPLGSKRLRMVEVEPRLLRTDEGRYVTFRLDAYGNPSRMFMSGSLVDPVGFRALAWYERGTLHALLLGTTFVIALLVCVARGFIFLRHLWRRRRSGRRAGPKTLRRAWQAATLVSALVLLGPLFLLGRLLLGDPEAQPYRIESSLTIVRRSFFAASLLSLLLPFFAVRLWQHGEGSVWRRVCFSVVVLVLLLLVGLLLYWGLPGWK